MRTPRGSLGTDEKTVITLTNEGRSWNESRSWARAGVEPSTTALLADPIAILLMRADRLTTQEVEIVLRTARRRRIMREQGSINIRPTPQAQAV